MYVYIYEMPKGDENCEAMKKICEDEVVYEYKIPWGDENIDAHMAQGSAEVRF